MRPQELIANIEAAIALLEKLRREMVEDKSRVDSMLHAWKMVEIANRRLSKHGIPTVNGPLEEA